LAQCESERASLSLDHSESISALSHCQRNLTHANYNLETLTQKETGLELCELELAQVNRSYSDAINKFLAQYALSSELAKNHSITLGLLGNCQDRLGFKTEMDNQDTSSELGLQQKLSATEHRLEISRQSLALCQMMTRISASVPVGLHRPEVC